MDAFLFVFPKEGFQGGFVECVGALFEFELTQHKGHVLVGRGGTVSFFSAMIGVIICMLLQRMTNKSLVIDGERTLTYLLMLDGKHKDADSAWRTSLEFGLLLLLSKNQCRQEQLNVQACSVVRWKPVLIHE